MNLDEHKTGLHDSKSPINQKEEPQQIESITDAFEIGTEEDFYNRVSEVHTRLNQLRRYATQIDNEYLKKQLTIIYNLL